jgi:hypothetical protein
LISKEKSKAKAIEPQMNTDKRQFGLDFNRDKKTMLIFNIYLSLSVFICGCHAV